MKHLRNSPYTAFTFVDATQTGGSAMESPILFKPTTNGSKRPLARNRILSARFTESEYIALETFAWSKSMTLADWTRDALIQEMANKASTNLESHIFTELVGIQ